MFFGPLCVDVGPDGFQSCPADTANEVGPVPEQRFLVERCEVIGKTVAGTPGTRCLEVVDEE